MPSPSPSHHAPDGGYRNPWPDAEPRHLKDLLRWQFIERPMKSIAPDPPRDSLPRREPMIVAPRAAPGYRSVTWVGHATMFLQLGPLNVLTDPVWGERASPLRWAGPRRLMSAGVDFDALPEIDLVLLSHNHYDHLDAPTVRRIARCFPNATWLHPMGLGDILRSFGVHGLVERDWWQELETPAFQATCTPAQHFSARGFRDRNQTLWCGWTLAADDVRVYFARDTGLHPGFGEIASRLGPFDLVMLPIGAYEPRWFMRTVHMNPEDAIEAYRAIAAHGPPSTAPARLRRAPGQAPAAKPACLAMHWGTFRLTDEPVDEPPARFACRWRDAGFPDACNWTFAHGETRRF